MTAELRVVAQEGTEIRGYDVVRCFRFSLSCIIAQLIKFVILNVLLLPARIYLAQTSSR